MSALGAGDVTLRRWDRHADTVHDILLGDTTAANAISDGTITISGDAERVHELFDLVEPRRHTRPR